MLPFNRATSASNPPQVHVSKSVCVCVRRCASLHNVASLYVFKCRHTVLLCTCVFVCIDICIQTSVSFRPPQPHLKNPFATFQNIYFGNSNRGGLLTFFNATAHADHTQYTQPLQITDGGEMPRTASR